VSVVLLHDCYMDENRREYFWPDRMTIGACLLLRSLLWFPFVIDQRGVDICTLKVERCHEKKRLAH
jgi:hypothetical protein